MSEPIGILEAIAEILRRNGKNSLGYEEAETQLAEKMKPARLIPVYENGSTNCAPVDVFQTGK